MAQGERTATDRRSQVFVSVEDGRGMPLGKSLTGTYARYLAALDRTAVDAAAWTDACDCLAEMLDAKGAVLVADDYARHRLSTPHSASLTQAFDHCLTSGWNHRDIRHQAWKANLAAGYVRDQEVISLEAMRRHPFYAEFLLPHDLMWCATALFSVDGSIWGAAVHAGPDRDPFDDQDLETLLQLRLPLETAVKRATLLGQERLRPLEELLDASQRGLAVLDWNGRIVAASACGEALLESADIVKKGRLDHSEPALAADLGVLADFAVQDPPEGTRPQPAPVFIPTGQGNLVSVDAIPLPRDYPSLAANAAAVLVVHQVEPAVSHEKLLVERFQLTTREAQLVRHLIDGLPISQAAERMSITVGTARHHLKSIFAKTGASRQAELVARFSRTRD